MCTCQGCGNKYKLDLLIPDQLWEQIKPIGKPKGAGLLCPTCIVTRIENTFGYEAMTVNFVT